MRAVANAPLIVIAGSADPSRTDYDPPITDAAAAKNTVVEIGWALAEAGCRICVYSSSPAFIEADVVRGYAEGEARVGRGVQVHYPANQGAVATFPEAQKRPELFDLRPDRNRHWEASYYRSLSSADGVVLIGGGPSALITGHIALAYRVPLVALNAFGGAAARVWEAISPGTDLPTQDELNLMARPDWTFDSAKKAVAALLAQRSRRNRERAEAAMSARRRATVAGLLFLVVLGLLLSVLWRIGQTDLLVGTALLLVGPIAGAVGATIRDLFGTATVRSFALSAMLGLVAGGISSLLYVGGQLATTAGALATTATNANAFVLALFTAVIGIIGGLTLDEVYRRLGETEVVRTDLIAAGKGG